MKTNKLINKEKYFDLNILFVDQPVSMMNINSSSPNLNVNEKDDAFEKFLHNWKILSINKTKDNLKDLQD